MHINKKEIFTFLSAFLIFSLASIYITFPLLFHLGDYTTGYGDELIIAWIHSWIIHALFTNPFSLMNANIIFPYPNTLAYSDLFLTGSLLTFPFVYFLGQPIVANNITLISSLVLLGFSLYLLTYYVTKNFFASLISGLVVIFSPATLSYDIQLQMLEIYWIPLALLFFLLFLNTKKTRFFVFFLLCFLVQVYNSFLPSYFIIFSSIIFLIFKLGKNKKKIIMYLTKKNFLLLFATLLVMIPLIIPYLQVSHEFSYVRDLRDSIHFALQPEDFLYPGTNTRLNKFLITSIPTNTYSQNNEFKPGYLGVIFSILVILTIGFIIKNRKKLVFAEKGFLTIALVGVLLSFGPFLHLNRQTIHHPFPIPLPYLAFYYIMPGFQGFRNSQRWEMLFILGMSVFIGLTLTTMLKNITRTKQMIIYCIVFIGIIVEFYPIHFVSVPQKKDFPKIYSWMTTTPKNSSFIFLPIYNWNTQPYVQQELFREYYSTIEFRKMVNGYSGFSPPPWQKLVTNLLEYFPDQKTLQTLKSMHITYIVVHKKEYDKMNYDHYKLNGHTVPNGNKVLSYLKQNKSVKLVKQFGNDYVFTFVR